MFGSKKPCKKCKVEKKLNKNNFHPRPRNGDSYDTMCRKCRNEENLERKHLKQVETNWLKLIIG